VTPLPTERAQAIIAEAEYFSALLMPMIATVESQLAGPQERLVWWAALMACLGGFAASGLGSEAVYAVSAMTEKLTSRVAAEKTAH
jgi:hypothetical protein